MKEAYVSFEIAKLLKEKGFNESTLTFYIPFEDGEVKFNIGSNEIHYNTLNEYPWIIAAPTHQMACAWLREKHHIHANPIRQGNYNDCSDYYTWIVASNGTIHRNQSVADKLSYEEAMEAALKYSLVNLL